MTATAHPLPAAATGVRVERHARTLAAAAAAGSLLGFVVNGWGSRLAMMLLARLNPEVTGRISDDGFRMGQFTLADTLGLVGFGTVVGVLGGLAYLAIRGLRFGPRWFQLVALAVGPAVVVGNMLIHTDGIDFRVLEPTVLAIALFVALPGLFALALALLVDRWDRPESRFHTGPRWVLLPLVAYVLLWPLGILAAGGTAAVTAVERYPETVASLRSPVPLWAFRSVLIAIFAVSLVALGVKVVELL